MSKLVLVVEDEEDNARIYLTILEHAGYETRHAADGRAALAAARESRPALILLDVAMPIMSGWEVCQTLKIDPEWEHVPIVMLTAHAMPSDRAMAFACGATGYIAKPAEPRAVLEQVTTLIGPP